MIGCQIFALVLNIEGDRIIFRLRFKQSTHVPFFKIAGRNYIGDMGFKHPVEPFSCYLQIQVDCYAVKDHEPKIGFFMPFRAYNLRLIKRTVVIPQKRRIFKGYYNL